MSTVKQFAWVALLAVSDSYIVTFVGAYFGFPFWGTALCATTVATTLAAVRMF